MNAEEITDLRTAARVFFSRPGPRFLAKKAGIAWLVRALLGPPRISDLALVALVAAWWPFQEWLAHKHLLHMKPLEGAEGPEGGARDPLFARAHRAHHKDPGDLDLTLLPMEVIRVAAPVNIAVWTVLGGLHPRRVATGVAAYTTMALIYEWTHFLVHTGVKPQSEFYARIRRNHRFHHYRNEAYWFSFIYPDVDRWLGTEPNPKDVPASPTAMNLHGLEGARPDRR